MAEGYFRLLAADEFDVQSAGVSPAGIHPMTMVVMREDGVDIAGQWSKSVQEIDAKDVDHLVTLCGYARERCPAFPEHVTKEHWPIEDPIAAVGTPEERLEKFRATRNELRDRVRQLIERLRNQN